MLWSPVHGNGKKESVGIPGYGYTNVDIDNVCMLVCLWEARNCCNEIGFPNIIIAVNECK